MDRRYWDACTFLSWFNDEEDKVEKCRGVVKQAVDGKLIIVTSALTLTEVVWLKGCPRLNEDSEDTIRLFFEQEYVAVRTVDRIIAERARQLVWKYNVKPKDSIHVATALQLSIPILDTFDTGLAKLDDKLGNPRLRIGPPNIPYQGEIDFEEETR